MPLQMRYESFRFLCFLMFYKQSYAVFLLQQPHVDDIVSVSMAKEALSGDSFLLESQLFIQLNGPVVKRKYSQIDSVQIHFKKTVSKKQLHRFGTIAFTPRCFIADINDAFGVPVFIIDMNQ